MQYVKQMEKIKASNLEDIPAETLREILATVYNTHVGDVEHYTAKMEEENTPEFTPNKLLRMVHKTRVERIDGYLKSARSEKGRFAV